MELIGKRRAEKLSTTFYRAFKVFPTKLKVRFYFTLLLMLLNSIIELVGLAAMIPLISIMMQDDFIAKSELLTKIYHLFQFNDEKIFILFICISALVIVMVKAVVGTLIFRSLNSYSNAIYKYFSTKLYAYFYQLDYPEFKKHNSSYIVSYINNHTSLFAQYFIQSLLNLLSELTVVFIILVTIILFNAKLVLLLAATVLPISALAYYMIRRKISGVGIKKAELSAELNKSVHESIEGYIDVKTLNKGDYFYKRYINRINTLGDLNINSTVLLSIPSRIIETGTFLGIICLVIYSLMSNESRSQTGILLSLFAVAAYRIMPSVNRIITAFLSIKEHQYTVDVIELADFGNIKSKSEEANSLPQELKFRSQISIKNLSYAYKGQELVLSDLNMQINKGDVIGIIGRSGSGKTTLINILLRFLKQTRGSITVDDTEINEFNESAWRHSIGYVQQSVFISDGTITENIAFGIEEEFIDHARVMAAAETASLKEFIESLTEGFQTRLGERGSKLSGGQRQRIGIARAIYSGAEILIFDEATSALDSQTETEITESIKGLSKLNLTMLIVAHRYSTLKYCNRIFQLDKGAFVKELTYDELH